MSEEKWTEAPLKISDRMRFIIGAMREAIRYELDRFPVEVELQNPYERCVFSSVIQFDRTMHTPTMPDAWWPL